MIIRKYEKLPEEAIQIRNEVFVKEQGFLDEFDAIDDISSHLVLFQELLPIATCRYYWNEMKSAYVVGRIAVLKAFRGKNIGALILKEAERQIPGGSIVYLSAQVRVAGFYEKQGYTTKGVPYYDEYCPHIWMSKEL